MNLNLHRLSLVSAALLGLSLSHSAKASIARDEQQPLCPQECRINYSDIVRITDNIINGGASLMDGSCGENIPNSEWKFQYSKEGEDEGEDQMGDTAHRHRHLEAMPGAPGGPNGMSPHPDFDQTKFGWRFGDYFKDTGTNERMGFCYMEPNVISGPHPIENLNTCINTFSLACSQIENANGPGDEPQPECPRECGIDSIEQIGDITNKIINGDASLMNGSCGENDPTNPNSIWEFQYSIEGKNEEKDPMGDKAHRHLQSISGAPGGPNGMIPPPDFEQTEFGWRFEYFTDTETNEKMGTCRKKPGIISGPHSQENLNTCINKFSLACSQIGQSGCPCYSLDYISAFKANLREKKYDPETVLDLEKSCKDPKDNNGLPFGLYTKERVPGQSQHYKKPLDLNNSNIVKGVDLDVKTCHDGADALFGDLSTYQHNSCISTMEYICAELKTLKKQDTSCQDDTDYKFKPGKTCEKLISTNLRQRRNCGKYDWKTKKFVFQHCRKSCQSCTCSDNVDFAYNGQEDYTCEWIDDNEEKESFCKDPYVAENCKATCNSKCCQDSSTFKFRMRLDKYNNTYRKGARELRRKKKYGCDYIGQNEWMDICKSKKVARNCPMKCRKCFIQPRMGK